VGVREVWAALLFDDVTVFVFFCSGFHFYVYHLDRQDERRVENVIFVLDSFSSLVDWVFWESHAPGGGEAVPG